MNSRNEFVRRRFAQIVAIDPCLHDPAFVHEHDLVAEIGGFGQIVRNQKGGLLQPRENFLQIVLQTQREQVDRARRAVRRAEATPAKA